MLSRCNVNIARKTALLQTTAWPLHLWDERSGLRMCTRFSGPAYFGRTAMEKKRGEKILKKRSQLEKVAGCGKRRPSADLAWLFSQVTDAIRTNSGEVQSHTVRHTHSLFQLFSTGTVDVSLLDQQTYRQWRSFMTQQKLSHPRRLRQRTIILQPFTAPSLPGYALREIHPQVLEHLRSFCAAYFRGMSVETAPSLDLTTLPNLTARVHRDTQRVQYLVGDIIRHLERWRPSHVQCVMAVTTVDLYPSPEWNFVLGHASLTSGCGVFGFGRYFSSQFSDSEPSLSQQLEQLWVLTRVVSHELCHTLGMKHCYYFKCAMNESASIEEASRQPLFLCPVCLRKLKKWLRFDVFARYKCMKEAIGRMLEVVQSSEQPHMSSHTLTVDNTGSATVRTGDVTMTACSSSQLEHLHKAVEWLKWAEESYE